MGEPIEEAYFDWLCAKVLPLNTRNYQKLMEILYCTEFAWFIPGDRNRAQDGIEFREYFINETGFELDQAWYEMPCSLLEFFIAFAHRAQFQTEKPLRDWFWTFMANLKLDEYRYISDADLHAIEEILYTFVWREYDSLGRGGIFPMSESLEDQRGVELWYQFNAYVTDQGLI